MYREIRNAVYKLVMLQQLVEKISLIISSRLIELNDLATKTKTFEESNKMKVLDELEKLINQISEQLKQIEQVKKQLNLLQTYIVDVPMFSQQLNKLTNALDKITQVRNILDSLDATDIDLNEKLDQVYSLLDAILTEEL